MKILGDVTCYRRIALYSEDYIAITIHQHKRRMIKSFVKKSQFSNIYGFFRKHYRLPFPKRILNELSRFEAFLHCADLPEISIQTLKVFLITILLVSEHIDKGIVLFCLILTLALETLRQTWRRKDKEIELRIAHESLERLIDKHRD